MEGMQIRNTYLFGICMDAKVPRTKYNTKDMVDTGEY
jgi:hypothetical protein